MLPLLTPRNPYRAAPAESAALRRAYAALLRAHQQAEGSRRDSWIKPVPIRQFRRQGIEDAVLLWTLYQGHAAHYRLAAGGQQARAQTQPAASLVFDAGSVFVLTEGGRQFADHIVAQPTARTQRSGPQETIEIQLGALVPTYDRTTRILSWGVQVLKHFRQPAANQVWVLRSAEELGWPEWFDDPLPHAHGIDGKRRLHDTIKGLNHNQRPWLIQFRGDGTAKQVGWKYR